MASMGRDTVRVGPKGRAPVGRALVVRVIVGKANMKGPLGRALMGKVSI